MKRICAGIAMVAVSMMSVSAVLAAGAADETKEIVARFVGRSNGTVDGKPMMLIQVAPVPNGKPLKMALPDKEMSDLAGKLKQGDYVTVLYTASGRNLMVGKLDAYALKPGEDQPNVFVFVKYSQDTVGKKEVTTVTVSLFGKETVLTIPAAKNAEGKMAPKEDIMKVVESLKADDLVEIHAAGNPLALKSIKLYEPPRIGKFVKAGKDKVGEDEVTSVEISGDEGSQTLMIAKKDTALTGKVRTFKAGDMVSYRVSTDDKATAWLVEIKAAPKGSKPTGSGADTKPATKKPPIKPAPKDDAGK